MTNGSYSDYEYRVAMALSSHPGLACFDDMNVYSSVQDKSTTTTSLWELPSIGSETEEVDDYDEHTVRVDVFQVALNPAREASLYKRPFRFYPAVRVVSSSLKGFMPSADLIMVDAFPLTRDVVLQTVRAHLLRTEYAKEQNEFLWGPDLVKIREDLQG